MTTEKRYSDVERITVTAAYATSISHGEDDIEIEYATVDVDAHYWAEPVGEEWGPNRPDYDDDINIFFADVSDEDLVSARGIKSIERQCLERMRNKLCDIAGRKLSFAN